MNRYDFTAHFSGFYHKQPHSFSISFAIDAETHEEAIRKGSAEAAQIIKARPQRAEACLLEELV
jgi:hypothetical protein